MAIIDNLVPPEAGGLPTEFKRRVVVKFRPDIRLPYSAAAADELKKYAGLAWGDLIQSYPGLSLMPYFTDIEESRLNDFAARPSKDVRSSAPKRFTDYYAIECPKQIEPQEVAKAVSAWPNVEIAYVEGGPTPPPVNASDDPRSSNQGYLDASPAGIDARWVWSSSISDGNGVGFVDLERGWTLNHEDLAAANITIISGLSQDYHGHGTAVLGEVVGSDNTIGGIGIAPAASARVVSQWRNATTYNTAEAILSAVGAMNYGDVLLLEAQTTYSGASGYVPVEVEQAVFDAIDYATSQGIVVVEAGANGSVDLDEFKDLNGKKILNRGSADYRDSGAIMVGATSSVSPHQRLSFSNYGSRIDCYAWGQNIDTCGDGWTGTATNSYTSSFGGTSGASPIVTGAALLLQAYRIRQGFSLYSPFLVRALLSNSGLNTPSANPPMDRIGVMPNLREIIESENLRLALDLRRWSAVVWILFGVIQDGGGIVIKPGSGPIPIDPWGPLVPQIAAEKRDILVGLATTEVASLLYNETSRRALNKAGLTVIRHALEELGRTL